MKSSEKKPNKVLILLDFENLYINYPSRATLFEELDKNLKQIAQEVGAISKVFVFAPFPTAAHFAEDFYHSRFITILCPKVKNKSGEEEDTVDEMIRSFGQELINEMPNLTHLIIGSGDVDFLPLIINATRKGLDVGLIVGSLEQLATDLIKKTDKKPNLKDKMVYILYSPEKKD